MWLVCKPSVRDYSVVSMERILRLERKSLSDLITTLMQYRARFFDRHPLKGPVGEVGIVGIGLTDKRLDVRRWR